MAIRVLINEAKFRDLVAGKVATCWSYTDNHEVEVMLADIGGQRMIDAVITAITEPHRPPDPPQAREFLPARRRKITGGR
jgi:hypothetical protein